MIIVKLMGGLGNQMFQYAAARRLGHVSNVPLKLDVSWFGATQGGVTPRDYALGPFRLAADLTEEGRAFPALLARVPLLGSRFSPFGGYLREKHFHFDAALLTPRRTAYLDGYWQSEKYFLDIRDILINELSVKDPPRGMNGSLAARIAAAGGSSVSLHVRRGDYVNNPDVTRFHGTCTLDYYAEAVSRIAARVQAPHFFIFSDDPDWVASHLVTGHPHTIVSHNGPEAAHEDLRLMSLCSHHIIANSTFSWWGAWLCANADKVVIAPRRWFATDQMNADDLVPASWTRI